MPDDLEQLYQDAKSALKSRDYNRAGGLLKEILRIDENYKDASRLLAQSVRLKRRRWYQDPRLWAAAGLIMLVGLGAFLAPRVRELYAHDIAEPTSSPMTATAALSTSAATPAPTDIPLTWNRISVGQEFARDLVTGFEIDPNDPEVLYVRMEHAGYYKSINGGVSWQPTAWADAPANIQAGLTVYRHELPVHMQGAEVVPLIVSNAGPDAKQRLYRVEESNVDPSWSVSQDGGTTWSTLGRIGKPKSVAIGFDAAGSVYVSCSSHLCKYSPDGKQQVQLGAPDIGTFTIIVISPNDPSTIYVAGNGLSVSHDAGQNSTKLNDGLGSAPLQLDTGWGNTPPLYVQSGQCSDDLRNDLAGLPLYLSNDRGISWTLSLQAGCYLIKDSDQKTMYRVGRCADCLGLNGWIWRSPNAGKSWEKRTSPGAALALVADPSQLGFLYASMLVGYQPLVNFQGMMTRQRLFYSEDHGNSWKMRGGPENLVRCSGSTAQSMDPNRPQFLDSNWPMAIDPRDGKHVLDVVRGVMFESRDSCIHDTHLFKTPPPGLQYSIAFDTNHPSTLYAGTDNGAYVSINDGQTWGQIKDGLLGVTVVYSITVDPQSNVYAATPYGIFKLETK